MFLRYPVIFKGRVVGYSVPQRLLFITYRKPHHFFRKYRGFGISKDLLEYLYNKGIRFIRIEYDSGTETVVYETHIDTFLNSPIEFNYQGDIQKVVPVDKLKIVRRITY